VLCAPKGIRVSCSVNHGLGYLYVHDAQVPIPPEGKMERGGGEGILSGVAMLPDVAEHDSSRPVVELWPRKEEKGKRRRAYI
jgi:hypothetical protein